METKQYTTIDRDAAGWPKGEWDKEPVQFECKKLAAQLQGETK